VSTISIPRRSIDDEYGLPDEAYGSIFTSAEKSASQARRAPKIGERSRENEVLPRRRALSNQIVQKA